MKILFLVHVEEMFREEFPDKLYVPRLLKAFCHYDRVICFCSHVQDQGPIHEIERSGYTFQQIHWGWGYEKDQDYDEDEGTWVIPVNGHHTWIPEELRYPNQWNKHTVKIGGGCKNECLQDFKEMLDYMNIRYEVVEGYCY